jgi:hypothetical protein
MLIKTLAKAARDVCGLHRWKRAYLQLVSCFLLAQPIGIDQGNEYSPDNRCKKA